MATSSPTSPAYSPFTATFESLEGVVEEEMGSSTTPLDEEIRSYRAKLNQLDTAIDTAINSTAEQKEKSVDEKDDDIEIIRTSITTNGAKEQRSGVRKSTYNVDKALKSLHRFFVFVARSRMHRKESDAISLAQSWITTWASAGYTYKSLLKRAEMGHARVQRGLAPKEELPRKLWESLKAIKHSEPKEVTLSFLVNRTVEHFNLVFEKRARKKKALGLDDADEKAIESFIDKEVKLVPLDPPNKADINCSSTPNREEDNEKRVSDGVFEADSSSSEVTSSSKESSNNAVSKMANSMSEITTGVELTTNTGIVNRLLAESNDPGLKVDREFRDFLWQKVSSLSPSIQATTLAVECALRVLHQCDLRPQTALSWCFLSREEDKVSALPALFKLKLSDVSRSLPILCPLTQLTSYLIDFCNENEVEEGLTSESNRQSYKEALRTLMSIGENAEVVDVDANFEVIDVEADDTDSNSRDGEPLVIAERSVPSAYTAALRNRRSRSHTSSIKRRRTSGSDSSASSKRRKSGKRKKRSARGLSIDHYSLNTTPATSTNNAFHKLPYHPMCHLWGRPLTGFSDQSLKVYCHVEAFATGPVISDLVQVAACVDGSEADNATFFEPLELRSISYSIQRVFNLKTKVEGDKESQVFTTEDGEEIECRDERRVIRSFLEFVDVNLKTTKCQDAVLVFGLAESAFYLLNALASVKSSKLEDAFFRCIRGFCFLEPLIKSQLLRREDLRLTFRAMVRTVLMGQSRKWDNIDVRDSYRKASLIKKLFKTLRKKHQLFGVDDLVLEVNHHVIDNFADFHRRIRRLAPLRAYLLRYLNETQSVTAMRGLFSLYPSKACDHKVAQYVDPAVVVASTFVELLLHCGLSYSRLLGLEDRRADVLIGKEIESCMRRVVENDNRNRMYECARLTRKWIRDEQEQQHPPFSEGDLRLRINGGCNQR